MGAAPRLRGYREAPGHHAGGGALWGGCTGRAGSGPAAAEEEEAAGLLLGPAPPRTPGLLCPPPEAVTGSGGVSRRLRPLGSLPFLSEAAPVPRPAVSTLPSGTAEVCREG